MIVTLALKTCSTLLCAAGTPKRKMRTSSSRRWCSLCSASSCHCCCTSAGDGSSDCVAGKNSSRGDNWSNAKNELTMDCSRLLEIQLGMTGLYHGDRYDTRFVYLPEAFNHLWHPTMCSSYFSLVLPSVQAGWLPSVTITPSSSQRMEFCYLRTAFVRHQNSNYNEFCVSGSECGRCAACTEDRHKYLSVCTRGHTESTSV